jgi:sigma-B regulation protein RsbU (phosphoserine phosphatase)
MLAENRPPPRSRIAVSFEGPHVLIQSKAFYRRLEQVFASAGRVRHRERFAMRIAPALLELLSGPLAVAAVHVHEPRKEGLTPAKKFGASRPDLAELLAKRLNSTGDDGIKELPWVGDTNAGRIGLIAVGGLDGPLLVLFGPAPGDLERGPSRSDFLSALNSLLYAMRQHLERRELEDVFEQARNIQMSLLPPGKCEFPGFDIFAISTPTSSVGGDLYDFLPIAPGTLGVAVADASGHGLPAALQARDVAVGLRMGVERDLKITATIEKLNRVIHRSGLTSRFISLVFGELETNGNFSYINAGHPPALLLDSRGLRELSVGGIVLGPDADATYKLGFQHVDRGATLALYSDGVIERGTQWGLDPFGLDRLKKWMKDWRKGPSEKAVLDLMQRLKDHCPGRAFEDDVTVMLLRREN